jgi:hypothetical protein
MMKEVPYTKLPPAYRRWCSPYPLWMYSEKCLVRTSAVCRLSGWYFSWSSSDSLWISLYGTLKQTIKVSFQILSRLLYLIIFWSHSTLYNPWSLKSSLNNLRISAESYRFKRQCQFWRWTGWRCKCGLPFLPVWMACRFQLATCYDAQRSRNSAEYGCYTNNTATVPELLMCWDMWLSLDMIMERNWFSFIHFWCPSYSCRIE